MFRCICDIKLWKYVYVWYDTSMYIYDVIRVYDVISSTTRQIFPEFLIKDIFAARYAAKNTFLAQP